MPTIEKDTAELENELTNAQDLTQFIETNEHDIPELSVSQYLEQLLNKYQLNRAEIITASCIERTYGHHIFSGKKRLPGREKLIAIALAMKINHQEVQKLLYYGHHERLYVKNSWDKFIWYAINKKLTVMETNDVLLDLGLRPLLL
jgi:hypothetical protein